MDRYVCDVLSKKSTHGNQQQFRRVQNTRRVLLQQNTENNSRENPIEETTSEQIDGSAAIRTRQARGRRRPREPSNTLETGTQATGSLALPLIGSRDLTELFNEIFYTARHPPEARVRRVRQPREVGPVRKVPRSPPNWFLKQGQTFSGWQHVQHWPPGTSEKWNVRVVIDYVDFTKGEVFGTMTASNVPYAQSPVVTFFEGQIIDNENATFYSDPDSSARACLSELRHWSRFPAFRPLRDSVLDDDGRAPGLKDSRKVFMRWKEKCFLYGGDSRLTIAGLYYVTLDRKNGDINAYYFDPNSAPEQKMILRAGLTSQGGYSLPLSKMA